MKKWIAVLSVLLMLTAATAFAGGDQNQNRHDGGKGQGEPKQERVNQ